MKTIYSIIAALAISFAGAFQSLACQYSNFTLVSETNLGNGLYQYTATFCVGNGPGGAVSHTLTWGVVLDNGAVFTAFPATLTSPATGAVYVGDATSYGPNYLIYDHNSGGWSSTWACTNSACGPAGQVCKTFTFTTNGRPNTMTLIGAEGNGVGVAPYGCNGDPAMVINLQGFSVEAGPTQYKCLGVCANLSAAVTGGVAPYTYSWVKQYTGGSAGTAATISVCPTQNELYLLTVTDATGSVTTDNVMVVVYQPPVASAGADQIKYLGYGATSFTFTGYANNSMGPYTYAWSNGATTKNITVSPVVTTNYTLTVTDARGCTQTDVAQLRVIDIRCGSNKVSMCKNNHTYCVATSQVPSKLNQGYTLGACGSNKTDEDTNEELTEEITAETMSAIFPNPASSLATVNFTFATDVNITLGVYDVSGRLIQNVISNKAVAAGYQNTEAISVAEYPSGFYFIGITASNGERIMHKLMVAR